MIITVTANPAVDIVYGLSGVLDPFGLNRAKDSAIFAGGKGINVSRAILACGGGDCIATICLTGGNAGRLLTEKLAGEGIVINAIPTFCETRVNVCAVSSNGEACEINAPGGPVTSAELDAFSHVILHSASFGDTVILAGSLPVMSDGDGKDYWASMIPRLKEKGCTVILDCSGEALRRAVFGKTPPDYIKPNLNELCELLEIDTKGLLESVESEVDGKEILFKTAENASKTLAERGISVLVTLGSIGSVFTSAKNPTEHIRQNSVPVSRVTNIKGAGDTFLGTFAYHYFVQNCDVQSSLASAAQAAADHVAGTR